MRDKTPRVRFAETTASIGAGVLGMGLGVFFAKHLGGFAFILILAGALMHAWGMFDMKHMETDAGQKRPVWSTLLYWLCWGMLGLLILWILGSRVAGFSTLPGA